MYGLKSIPYINDNTGTPNNAQAISIQIVAPANINIINEIDFMNFRYSLLFHKSPKGFKNGFITNALTKLIIMLAYILH